ncbi:class I SAM-dependent methyltransferase [Acaryochloris marina NIES-2412]|uniref:class I SAM-dependent methyltransferase n=1 Tax=Acaryochloris marina TaxID=155978 RepID=UPI0040599830
MPEFPYIHSFSKVEQERLRNQARFAEYAVYQDVDFTRARNILEVGCGVGAQSEILLRRFPHLFLTGIDKTQAQLEQAQSFLSSLLYAQERYNLIKMDAAALEFPSEHFDGAFICWLLEHVPDPAMVLSEVRRVLRKGSTLYVSEVMNSSFLIDPYSPNTWKYWLAFNDYQIDNGGDPFVGAKLGNLLMQTGYSNISTTPKIWHLDNRSPAKRKEMIEFWTELLLSASEQLVEDQRIDQAVVSAMKDELTNVARDPSSVFFYSFIQARATV